LWLLELLHRNRRVDRAPEPERCDVLSGRCRARGGGRVGGSLFLEIEDRALTHLGVLLGLLAVGLRFLEDLQHPLAAGTGRAERATLDQRLDRLLVDRAVVHALAEV